jgi:hypothetical protein
MLLYVTQCSFVSHNVTLCHTMLLYVTQCFFVSHNVTLCHTMLLYVTQCYFMSHGVTLCHTVLLYVTQCYFMSHSNFFMMSLFWRTKMKIRFDFCKNFRHIWRISNKTEFAWQFQVLLLIRHNEFCSGWSHKCVIFSSVDCSLVRKFWQMRLCVLLSKVTKRTHNMEVAPLLRIRHSILRLINKTHTWLH